MFRLAQASIFSLITDSNEKVYPSISCDTILVNGMKIDSLYHTFSMGVGSWSFNSYRWVVTPSIIQAKLLPLLGQQL